MTLTLFSFSVNLETQEAAFAGNIEPVQALQILQQIVIVEAVKRARQEEIKTATIKKEEQDAII